MSVYLMHDTRSLALRRTSKSFVSKGVPSRGNAVVDKYLQRRAALVQEEQEQRHDYQFRKLLSPTAIRACEIASQIRAREVKDVEEALHYRDNDDKAHHNKGDLHPKLWDIVKRMPKGSLLHAHLEAVFEVEYMIDQCMSTPGMYMTAEKPFLVSTDFQEAAFTFQYASSSGISEHQKQCNSIWMPNYESSSLIPVHIATASFPQGGKAGFRAWLKTRCVFMPEHLSTHDHHRSDRIWAVFGRVFPIIISILSYEPIFRRGFRRALSQLASDGVQYVEFRMGGWNHFQSEGSDVPSADPFNIYRVLEEEIRLFKASAEGKHFHGVRIIYAAKRSYNVEKIMDRMEMCIRLKLRFPAMICGFDLVAHATLVWFRRRCHDEGIDEIPLFLHAGECLGDGDATDQNLFDAILLGSRRIGHGFSLYKHPLLIDMIKQHRILIECCPISNKVLNLTNSIRSHPLPALLSRGVPVALCNDDPGIIGCNTGQHGGVNGLTNDIFLTVQALENLGLSGLGVMAENSVRWSCYEDQSTEEWQAGIQDGREGNGLKATRLQQWHVQFEEFCKWIVTEFGEAESEHTLHLSL
ncbi:hypothetical protein BDV37DRAFT_269920 [Aspergillus pseudonomiae]|uniref:adenosine deaminase n=1 Tax=Aspergillus pseudonomiae TaxID=1506151 RepID=A0A5N7DKS4_9EURO|nr:uncharacterized protein BDV37DRAFT_269920 [Aspergillus pseudonomiae]KAE8406593.1 hypothetical protein BDV37DRAFT_269920 [Aspergillus pseudonomiae]